MSMQQINLLALPPPGPRLSARVALGTLTLFLLGLLVQALWVERELQQLRSQEAELQADLGRLQAESARLQARLIQRDAQRSLDGANAAELRLRRALADHLARGELGSLVSPAPVLDLLARHRSDRLWLTAVSLTRAGTALRLEGQVLGTEPALDYVLRLRALLASLGTQVDALELDTTTESGADVPRVYSFRIH